jgi:D-amino peptidase
VKEGIGFTAAKTMHPLEARERITAGVKAAVGRHGQIAPITIAAPIALEIELGEAAFADAAMMVPGMERVDGTTVRYRAPDAVAAYQMSRLIMTLAR